MSMERTLLLMPVAIYGGLHLNSALVKAFPHPLMQNLPTSQGLKSDLMLSVGMTGSIYVILKTVEFLR